MNVQTHLKAGGLVQDAWAGAGQVIGKAEQAVATANQQAADLTRNVTGATGKVANCLAYSFNWR